MALLKAKQIQLASPNSLLVADSSGHGTTLSSGSTGTVLRIVDSEPAWTDLSATEVPFTSTSGITATNVGAALDELELHFISINPSQIAADFNLVTTQSSAGVIIDVGNDDASGSIQIATFLAGSSSDEQFLFGSAAGLIKVGASGTATDVSIALEPQGSGSILIGNSTKALIQSQPNLDLTILGGSGSGNLFLNSGGTGKVYYGTTVDPLKELATVNDIQQNLNANTIVTEAITLTGAQIPTLPSSAIASSIRISVNGLTLSDEQYSIVNNQIIFDIAAIAYSLDQYDQVDIVYDNATNGLGDAGQITSAPTSGEDMGSDSENPSGTIDMGIIH